MSIVKRAFQILKEASKQNRKTYTLKYVKKYINKHFEQVNGNWYRRIGNVDIYCKFAKKPKPPINISSIWEIEDDGIGNDYLFIVKYIPESNHIKSNLEYLAISLNNLSKPLIQEFLMQDMAIDNDDIN